MLALKCWPRLSLDRTRPFNGCFFVGWFEACRLLTKDGNAKVKKTYVSYAAEYKPCGQCRYVSRVPHIHRLIHCRHGIFSNASLSYASTSFSSLVLLCVGRFLRFPFFWVERKKKIRKEKNGLWGWSRARPKTPAPSTRTRRLRKTHLDTSSPQAYPPVSATTNPPARHPLSGSRRAAPARVLFLRMTVVWPRWGDGFWGSRAGISAAVAGCREAANKIIKIKLQIQQNHQ